VRDVLARTVHWTGYDSEFVPVTELPEGHRFFGYQRAVNEDGVPSEQVIDRHRRELGDEYRFSTEGEHPIDSLRASGTTEHSGYPNASR
jgi:hypothetical protein